jgi:hypothetical protein
VDDGMGWGGDSDRVGHTKGVESGGQDERQFFWSIMMYDIPYLLMPRLFLKTNATNPKLETSTPQRTSARIFVD